MLENKLQQAIQQQIEAQRQGLAGQEQQLQQMQQAPQELDLSSLMSLTDAWTGSRFTDSYKRPKNQSEKAREAMYLQQGVDARKKDLLKNEIELLKIMDKKEKGSEKKELKESMIKKLNEGNSIPDMLDNVDGLIGQNKDLFGPVVGRFNENNPYDTQSQSLNAEMRAKSQMFGRYMEGGVLRKEDEEKYRKMFPKLSDTPEVAREKLRIVKDLLEKKQRSDIDAFEAQGFDMTGLRKEFKQSFRPRKSRSKVKGMAKRPGAAPEQYQDADGTIFFKIGDEWVQQ